MKDFIENEPMICVNCNEAVHIQGKLIFFWRMGDFNSQGLL